MPAQASAAVEGIQGLNPSETPPTGLGGPTGPGSVVSDEDTTTDGTYHLVALVAGTLEAGDTVEARIDDGDTNTTVDTTVPLTQVRDTDTFEAFWDIPTSLDEGGGTITFAVVNGAAVVVSDQVPADFQHVDDTTPAAETVEITDPANGGKVGFFAGTETITGTVSSGVTASDVVDLFYTTTTAGQEPAWEACGQATVDDTVHTFSGTCSLQGGDARTSVTAVAARVQAAATAGADFGDAHRVLVQDVNVSVVPATDDQSIGFCNTYTVQLLDLFNESISVALNVDVHATGTSDLRFAENHPIEGDASDPFIAPDQDHPLPLGLQLTEPPPPATGTTRRPSPSRWRPRRRGWRQRLGGARGPPGAHARGDHPHRGHECERRVPLLADLADGGSRHRHHRLVGRRRRRRAGRR